MRDREIVLITQDNLFNYVQFPDYILKKWEAGVITNTHFSDLLRLELLIKYGGTWSDETKNNLLENHVHANMYIIAHE